VKLRVAIETQFARGTPTGLGVYASRLAAALRERADVEIVELTEPGFDLWRFDRRVYWDQLRVRRLARAAGADVVHFTGGTLPWRPPHPCVLTLHDLTWLRAANRGRAYVRWYFGRVQPGLARQADAIVVDTHAARADVADGLGVDPAHITVAGAGVEERFFRVARSPGEIPYVLCAGTVEQRKDLVTAVRAIARIPDVRLISAGPLTPYADEVQREIGRLGLERRVELRGYVDDDELLDLYAHAHALIFPSRYEGFGLPPLQALAAGLPVVASRIAVLEEVLGDCAWFAQRGDDRAFAAQLEAVLMAGPAVDEPVARGRARARDFTWAAVAGRMMSVYRSVGRSRT
jgi:glycosyltransferase involved in cell wall biosynthesis